MTMNPIAKEDIDKLSSKTEYEKVQAANPLVSWLHSFRYRNLLSLFKEFESTNKGEAIKVVEIGCAYAKVFSLLNQHFNIDYVGIEIDPFFVETARSRFSNYPNFRVVHDSATNAFEYLDRADIVIALETFEHIPENEVVRIVEAIAAAQPKLLVCSVPVEIGPAIWLKNVGSFMTGYLRHKEYRWRETFWAGLYQIDKIQRHNLGHAGFDWRWLAHTIRHNMKIKEIRRFPFNALPAAVAFTVFMVAVPRQD
jgi:Methyltransferase domain